MMRHPSIMFVCTANVCRSQYAHYIAESTVTNGLLSHLPKLDVQISSSGVFAISGEPICEIILPDDLRHSQNSSEIFNTTSINEDSLILVMEQRHQSELIKQWPTLRPRIFVLRNAVALLQRLVPGVQDESIFDLERLDQYAGFATPKLPTTLIDRWSWILQELDANRGMLPFVGDLSFSERFDIPDVHGIPMISHDATQDLIEQSVGMLMESLDTILGASLVQESSPETEGIR